MSEVATSESKGRQIFRAFQNRDEDRGELIDLVLQRGQFVGCNDAALDEQFEPVCGLFNFAKTISTLRDEFGPRSTSKRFSIIRPNRGAGPQNLFAETPRLRRFRQPREHSNCAKRKSFRPFPQIALSGVHATDSTLQFQLVKVPSLPFS